MTIPSRFHFKDESAMLQQQVCQVITLANELGHNRGKHLNGEFATIKALIDKFTLIEKQLEAKNKTLKNEN